MESQVAFLGSCSRKSGLLQDMYRAFVDVQLLRSKEILERRLGIKVDMLAWPFGIVDAELEAAARRAGYTTAFAFAGGWALPGGDMLAIPRIPVPNQAHGDAFAALVAAAPTRKPNP